MPTDLRLNIDTHAWGLRSVSALSPGRFEAPAWTDHRAIQMVTARQEVWLEKQ
jgi:hypothetical protein